MAKVRSLSELPRNFRRIRLELARERGHPSGSGRDGYEFVAPLTTDGHIDATLWSEYRDVCGFVRFRDNEDHRRGRLMHRPGGSWAFHYSDGTDEAAFHFQNEKFEPGEYVSISDGRLSHAYRIVSVEHP
jgi:hypothetical protein